MGLPSDFANGAVAVLTFNKEDRKI
jgi:hypothetical protein